MSSTIVAGYVCCPTCRGCLLELFACGEMSLSQFPFVEMCCTVLNMDDLSMSLLLLMPSGHGLLQVSEFFSYL